jgi:hypothetical protein
VYRDGAGKLLPLQSQHEKALDASSVTFVLVSRGAISKKEIEAIMEADGKFAVSIVLKWSRSLVVEPTKLQASPGQWHGAWAHTDRWLS